MKYRGGSLAYGFRKEMETQIEAKGSVTRQKRVVEEYEGWCQQEGFLAWPASYDAVSGYLCMFVMKLAGSSKSIDNLIHSLRVEGEEFGRGWLPKSSLRSLHQLMRQIKYNDDRVVDRKKPIRLQQLNAWTRRMDLADDKVLMFVVICYLGHDGLLRLGEIVSGLRADDIVWSYDLKKISIVLSRSKANRCGDPELVEVPDHRGRSAVKLMRSWFDKHNFWRNGTGLLFPGFRKNKLGSYNTVSDSWVRIRIKEMVLASGLNPEYYSGHSLRAGGATDLFVARVPYFLIKKMGRWESDAAMLYYRSEEDVVAAVEKAFSILARSGMGV